MAAATLTTYDAVVRELWPDMEVRNLSFEGSAYFALVEKDESFYEKIRHVPLQYGNPQGRSAQFAEAQTSSTTAHALTEDFQITRVSDYAVGIVDGETLETTRHDKAALLDAIETETRGALENLSNTLAFDLWRSGSGRRGVVGTFTTTIITLATSTDIINFEVGMRITSATAETSGLRTGSAIITEVDYDNHQLVTTPTWASQITSFTSGDSLFVAGDAKGSASAVRKVSGVPAWIPVPGTAITTATFFAVNRSVHPTRFAGDRYVGTGHGTIMEAIKRGCAQLALRAGKRAKPKFIFMNPIDLDNLDIELQSKRDYERVDVPGANVGFDAISISTPIGRMQCLQDQWVPAGTVWALDMRTWKFASVDMTPRIIQHDGRRLDRQTSDDGVEFRAVYRGQLYCDAPGWNTCISIPS